MRIAYVTLAIVLTTVTFAAGEEDKPIQSDAESIQGKWRALTIPENGGKARQEDVEGSSVTFSQRSFEGKGNRTLRGDYELDPTTDPKQIDLNLKGENDTALAIKGIYRLEDDKLSVCNGADPEALRPTGFATTLGEKRTLIVLQRVSDIEGKWERSVKDDVGKVHRAVKEHQAGNTIVTLFDETGNIVHQHRSKYRLQASDVVRIFTYFSMEATGGPSKGQRRDVPSSYAFRIDGNKFYEIRGVLLSDARPLEIIVWQRVKDK